MISDDVPNAVHRSSLELNGYARAIIAYKAEEAPRGARAERGRKVAYVRRQRGLRARGRGCETRRRIGLLKSQGRGDRRCEGESGYRGAKEEGSGC